MTIDEVIIRLLEADEESHELDKLISECLWPGQGRPIYLVTSDIGDALDLLGDPHNHEEWGWEINRASRCDLDFEKYHVSIVWQPKRFQQDGLTNNGDAWVEGKHERPGIAACIAVLKALKMKRAANTAGMEPELITEVEAE